MGILDKNLSPLYARDVGMNGIDFEFSSFSFHYKLLCALSFVGLVQVFMKTDL